MILKIISLLFISFTEDDEVSSSPDTSLKARHSFPTFSQPVLNSAICTNSAQSTETLPEISCDPLTPSRATIFQTDELEQDWGELR